MTIIFLTLSILCLQKDPTASDAWAQVTGDTAVVYATVNNPSMYDVYLVSGKSDAAATVEFLNGDKPAASLTVAAYESLELKADGPRVRLSGLKSQLKAGDELKLTLETDGGLPIAIAAVVK